MLPVPTTARGPSVRLKTLLILLFSVISSYAYACTYDEHCPSMCNGSKVVPRGCTPDYRCEPIPGFARDCATATAPLTFAVNGATLSIPQTCLLTEHGASCSIDKPQALTELTVECVVVSEEATNLGLYREKLEALRIESARICRDTIEDNVIDLGVNIAFMGASGTGTALRDIAIAMAGVGTDQALGAGLQTNFSQKASADLQAWANTFSAGKATAAELCTFQEELRDVTIPVLETIWTTYRNELRECRAREKEILKFPDPFPRSPDLDLDPRDPRKTPDEPQPPVPPPPAAYQAACPCEDPGRERVPFVSGQSLAAAVAALQRCNLAGATKGTRYSDQHAAGLVVDQAPFGGNCVTPFSTVGLVQSLGPNVMLGLTVEPDAARMAMGETLAFDARITYADGSSSYLSYGSTWVANRNGRNVPMQINKLTPLEPGEYTVTASFEGMQGSTHVTVSPARTSIGRGNWNVYCSFEGKVLAVEGYSTGTMEGPFESQPDADGWIAVHCPSRACDRAFTCLEQSAGTEDLPGWESVPPGFTSPNGNEPDSGATDNSGWTELQGPVTDADDCALEDVQQAFGRAEAALAQQQMSDWAQSMRVIAGSNCRDSRFRSNVAAAVQALQEQQERESKISDLARNQPADFDYSGLLQTLTQAMDALNAASSRPGSSPAGVNPYPVEPTTTGSGTSAPGPTGVLPAGGDSSSQCQAIMARLNANSERQRSATWGSSESEQLQAEAKNLRAQSCAACGFQGAYCQ